MIHCLVNTLSKTHENAKELTKLQKELTDQTKELSTLKLLVKDTVLTFLYDDPDHPSAYKSYSENVILKLKLEHNIHLSQKERTVLLNKI